VVVCLERDADLHIAQLMLLPLTVSCFSKIQIAFTFLVPAHPDSPGKGPLNARARARARARACVCVYYEGYRFKTYRYTVKVPDTVIMNVNRNVCFVCCAEPSALDGSVHCINS